MCHAACQQNGIYPAVQHNGSRTDAFGNLVNHGIQHRFGMLVPFLYPADNGGNIGRAQVGCQSGTAGDALFEFVFCVAAGTAEVYQLPGRERTGTFRRERAFTVERVVYVDSLAMMMNADGYAAAQMADNQVEFFVARIMLGGIRGEPVMRAISSSSSTTPGSAMKARQPGSSAASSEAMRHPKLQAWVRMA